MDDTIDSRFYELLYFISLKRRQQIEKFRFSIDKKLSLYAEIVVRQNAIRKLCIQEKDILFAETEFGKPFLVGYPYFCFNISHTRNALAVAFADCPVGVDLERIREIDMGIANRFFTQSESVYISQTNDPDSAFYEIWTKKEAYIKWVGKGLSIPLRSFSVVDEPICHGLITHRHSDYIISVCSEPNSKFEFSQMVEEQIYLTHDGMM
jgi:4'-phosphopantetheinyl transferase